MFQENYKAEFDFLRSPHIPSSLSRLQLFTVSHVKNFIDLSRLWIRP